MVKIKSSVLKKYLKGLSKEDLEKEIMILVKNYPVIQEYYYSKLDPESDEVLEKYKKIILKEFSISRKEILHYPVIKKALKDFAISSHNVEQTAELMLFTVDCAVEFTHIYGDINQKFYHTIATIYEQALNFIVENDLEEKFVGKCMDLVDSSQDIAWGFGFDILEKYSQYLGHWDLN